jgi:E3 ubiquitin-protein ligase MYCBP2
VLVPLPEPATQIACGDNHTVVLLQSGQIYTFGKHQEGQLGRQKQDEDDSDTWHMVPRPVTGFGDHRKAMWVGARGNQTFIAVDESLVSETWISSCKVFSNSQMIGKIDIKIC